VKEKKNRYILITLWFIITVFFLIEIIVDDRVLIDSEIRQLFYLKMMLISAPLGYIFIIIIWLLLSLFNISMSIYTELFLNWSIVVITGYFQWFRLLPIFIKWIKKTYLKEINRG